MFPKLKSTSFSRDTISKYADIAKRMIGSGGSDVGM